MKIWCQNIPVSDYSGEVTPRFGLSEALLSSYCTARRKTLWRLYRSPASSAPSPPISEEEMVRWAGRGDVRVCPCGRGSFTSLRCSYNVATGGQPVTEDYNGIKRCCYILYGFHRTGLHKHDFNYDRTKKVIFLLLFCWVVFMLPGIK